MIWRERRVLLIVLALLLAVNTGFFFTYRVQYQHRLDDLDRRLEAAEAQLAQARAERVRAERTFQAYQQIQQDVQRVLDQHWSTQEERLTAMIAEVKRLAEASDLIPQTYGFTRAVAESESAAGRRRREGIGVTEVRVTFDVTGTYQQARRLINLLELSRQFVIIEQINLAAREGQALTLALRLKTLFRDDRSDVAGARL